MEWLKKLWDTIVSWFSVLSTHAPQILKPSTPIYSIPKKGDKSEDVKILQKALLDKGFDPGPIDGEFGALTQTALAEFQKSVGLTGTGVIPTSGGKTFEKLGLKLTQDYFDFSGPFKRLKLAEIAEAEGAKRLVWSPGSEADKYKKKFWPVFGTGKWPWCAAFTTWCCEQAGLKMPVNAPSKFGFTFALVEAWQQWAMERGFYHDNDGVFKPERGDLVAFDWDQLDIDERDADWEDHIGVFLRMTGSSFVCAEGNASNQTDIKDRTSKQIQGFIRIPDGFSFDQRGPPEPTPVSSRLKGFDMSKWQSEQIQSGKISFTKLYNAGDRFGFFKCTESVSIVDGSFQTSYQAAKAAGLIVGAYHFFRCDQDVFKQAGHFLANLKFERGVDLPPVIDFETLDGVSAETAKLRAAQWISLVEDKLRVTPIIYSGSSFLRSLGNISMFDRCPLWIAHYGVSEPKMPTGRPRWDFWQYASSPHDLNYFNGTLEDLKQFVKG